MRVCCKYSSDATLLPGADCKLACVQESVKYVFESLGFCLLTARGGGEGQKVNQATCHDKCTHTHRLTNRKVCFLTSEVRSSTWSFAYSHADSIFRQIIHQTGAKSSSTIPSGAGRTGRGMSAYRCDHSQRDSAFFLLSCQLLQKWVPVFRAGDCGCNCALVFSLARLWERAGKAPFLRGLFIRRARALGSGQTQQHKGPRPWRTDGAPHARPGASTKAQSKTFSKNSVVATLSNLLISPLYHLVLTPLGFLFPSLLLPFFSPSTPHTCLMGNVSLDLVPP